MGDHTEAVRIHFDTNWLTLDELFDIFWASHSPELASRNLQYRAALFCNDDAQIAAAKASIEREAARRGHAIMTPVVSKRSYTPAEDYHQKWRLRRNEKLFRELLEHYDDEAGLLASTAAAKLNAYVGGVGRKDQVERDIERLGLSADGRERLLSVWRARSA